MRSPRGMAASVQLDRERFEQAMRRIMQALGTRTQNELADKMGFRQASISYARRRGTIPDTWLLRLVMLYRINPAWVISGCGSRFLVPQDATPEAPDYAALIKNAPVPVLLRTLADRMNRPDIAISAAPEA